MKPAKSSFKGHAPTVKIGPAEEAPQASLSGKDVRKIIGNPERFKYEAAWDHPGYREWSPGEQMVPFFLQTATPERGTKIIDWGAGCGRAAHKLWKAGLDVTMVDFVDNCLDEDVRADLCDSFQFVKHDLTQRIDLKGDIGFCCDVLEHIPEEDIDQVLDNMFENCHATFFQIATVEDHFSKEIDGVDQLHVTVRPYEWWLKKFAEKEVIVHASNEFEAHVCFYISSHRNFWWTRCAVNTDQDTIHANIRENAKWGVKQLRPHEPQDIEVMMLCGGPSLNDFEDEIIQKHKDGMPVITMNATYQWAQERGIHNVNQFVIDAREFNNRFVDPVRDDCTYFVASQAHPSVFEKLPKDRTWMWHVSLEDDDIEVTKEAYGEMYKEWFPIPGGCTVALRALNALQMMGFRKIHIYGLDSCLTDDEVHHAYEQEENDNYRIITVTVGKGTKHEREFKCHDFMAVQAKELMKLTPIYYSDLDLAFYGDGLIPYLVNTGASIT